MKEFEELLAVADRLNRPGGCPWDLKQTFASLRPYILEEAYEALEAIDGDNDAEIIEELGDLFYTVVFYAKVAEREKRFSIKEILEQLKTKLIRRHPHVFGDAKARSVEDVVKTWNAVKKEEKKERKSPLDGIPKALPSLQRAQKVLTRIELPKMQAETRSAQLAEQILEIVKTANEEKVDLESAVREALQLHSTQE